MENENELTEDNFEEFNKFENELCDHIKELSSYISEACDYLEKGNPISAAIELGSARRLGMDLMFKYNI